MDGLYKLINALSNGTIPDTLRPPLLQNVGFATPARSKLQSKILGNRVLIGASVV